MAYIGEMQYLTIGNNTYSLPTGGEGGIDVEVDPVFSASPAAGITTADISNWNGKSSTDTKNTAGSTNSTSKLYLIGATSQAANPQTYSNSNLYFSDGLKSVASAGNGTIIARISQSYNSIQLSYIDDNTYQNLLINSSGINAKGNLNLYASNSASNYTKLVSSASTSNQIITFPDATGTVALTSDIPTVSYPVTSVNNKTGAVSLTASDVGAATSDHTHGNITNGGDITATAPTIASGDQIIINDNSASKITNGPTFDGSTTTKALTQKGTWETFSSTDTKNTAGATNSTSKLYLIGATEQSANPQTYSNSNLYYDSINGFYVKSPTHSNSHSCIKQDDYGCTNIYAYSSSDDMPLSTILVSSSEVFLGNRSLEMGYNSSIFINDGDIYLSTGANDKHVYIHNLGAPSNDTDAATKKYVDDSIGAIPAASITLNGTSTTSASFYAPTTAGTSSYVLKSNGSGAAPTWVSAALTDTKLQVENLTTNYNSSSTYNVVLRGSGEVASTGYISNIYFSHVGGSTSSQGYANLKLGNETATGTNGNSTGRLTLYASNNKYTQIDTNTLTNNNIITLPSNTGTLALTSDIPTNTDEKLAVSEAYLNASYSVLLGNGESAQTRQLDGGLWYQRTSGTPATANLYVGNYGHSSGNLILEDGISHYTTINTDTQTANRIITLPDKTGTVALTSDIPTETTVSGWGFTKNTGTLTGVTFAGTSMSVSSGVASITQANARTALGLATVATSGSYNDLTNKPTIPTITLNGSSTTSPAFYAPTAAGTSGQFLKSSGSGAPSWSTLAVTDIPTLAQTKISANSANIEFDYTGDSYTTNSLSDVTNALIDEIDATQTAMENITAIANSKPNIKITRW